jgi:hypothetical protein
MSEAVGGSGRVSRVSLPWGTIVVLALLGTLLSVFLALVDLHQTQGKYGGLLDTGPHGPAAALLRREFPHTAEIPVGEHDGPMFYAVARDPFHLKRVSAYLDRPRYRLQHPFFAWLSWAAHPWGGGDPMMWTMFGVGVAGVLLGGIAIGALSTMFRGPPWTALLFGVMPGAITCLRITVGDALAVGLLLAAIGLSFRGHDVLAALAGIAAVLTKEPMLLGLIGVALWRRDRRGVELALPAAVVLVAWYAWLRIQLGPGGEGIMEFGVPLVGLASSIRLWASGSDLYDAISVTAALVVAIAALARTRWRHPLSIALTLQLGFMLLLTRDVIGLNRNGTRMSLVVLALGLVVLVTPRAAEVLSRRRPQPEVLAADG